MNRISSKIGLVAAALSLHVGGAFADEILVGAEIPLTGSLARVGAGMHEGFVDRLVGVLQFVVFAHQADLYFVGRVF